MNDQNELPLGEESIQRRGGLARAKSLTAAQRKAISAKASTARWNLPKAKWGTPDKKLTFGDRELECYVLEDGTRVLSGRGMQEALGLGQTHGGILNEFLSHENIKSFIESDLAMELSNPLRFIRPGRGGIPAVAHEATILPRLCDAVLEARKRNPKLTKRQRDVAEQCEVITRVLSKVGIIALVDEITGYQSDRARDALAKILEEFIAKELQPWTRAFPLEFYKQIFRLREWPFDPATMQSPRVLGKYTNNIVYARLAPGVLDELRKKSPSIDGRRKHKLYRWLTGDVGHPKLLAHLEGVKIIMRESKSWEEFLRKLDYHYPVIETTELGFDVELSST